MSGLATRRPGRLVPDPRRVIAHLFVPGHALPGEPEGRASGVVDHVLSLADDEVELALASIMARFAGRHRDLPATLRHHADRIRNRIDPDDRLNEARWLLLGATFTQELAVEAASLCNPSIVPAPDQRGAPAGALRFVMSVRQIGEGHRSSVGFRTGIVDAEGAVTTDVPGPFTTAGVVEASPLEAASLRDGSEAAAWAVDRLGPRFSRAELEVRLAELESQGDTRRDVADTVRRIRELASRTYTTRFPPETALDERVLLPATSTEANGIEDARFVRFTDDDGSVTYRATCTAFDGHRIAQQLLTTTTFESFTAGPLLGAAAANKGLALFPRRIGGRFAALSRFDGSSNALARSDDLHLWDDVRAIRAPRAAWETVQIGNCGSPIETDEGWLVLTHGVGPMRTYSIGAWLLDLEDPMTVIAQLREPLLSPTPAEQDGYVPNVVYSCGALVHAGNLVLPYGISDAAIAFATAPVSDLLAAMT